MGSHTRQCLRWRLLDLDVSELSIWNMAAHQGLFIHRNCSCGLVGNSCLNYRRHSRGFYLVIYIGFVYHPDMYIYIHRSKYIQISGAMKVLVAKCPKDCSNMLAWAKNGVLPTLRTCTVALGTQNAVICDTMCLFLAVLTELLHHRFLVPSNQSNWLWCYQVCLRCCIHGIPMTRSRHMFEAERP